LQIVGQFLKEFLKIKTIYVPNPTWGNHHAIFKRAGLDVKLYAYYKTSTRGLDFEGMVADLEKLEAGTAVLLHACAHNPTGVDPTKEQWEKIVKVVAAKKLVPILDNAYQGYASGDLNTDGHAQRLFEHSGMEYFMSQSFAKNFGLYGERIGYVHVLCASKERATVVLSQLKILIRQAYSSPPRHGASIVNKLLMDPELKKQWLGELKFMSERIVSMRTALRTAVEKLGTPGTWSHITEQIGMFTFTGLDNKQVESLIKDWHIYLTKDGRISMAGITTKNVNYVAQAIHGVVTAAPRANL
jgi:aspartate/tyrosine/aromatic aminotransferase